MKIFKNKIKAFSLIELILAIGVFATISSMIVFLVVDATKTLDNTRTRAKATDLINEIDSALLLLKDQTWQNIAINSDDGDKHIEFVSDTYQIVDGPGTYEDLTYSFNITSAQRLNGSLVDTGGEIDPHTRVINISIDWIDSLGRTQTITPKIYLNDWNTYSLIDTTVADFTLGSHTNTYVDNILDGEDGEVSLVTMLYSDWCNPLASTNSYDLGGGVPKSISTYNEYVIMGSGDNASGDPFIKIFAPEDLNTNMPDVIEREDFSTQDKTNDIFLLDETHALLATDTNDSEVLILEMGFPDPPYIREVGYFDIPTNADGDTISAYGDIGYVTESNNLISFDITNILGTSSQQLLQSISLGGQANKTHATDIYVDEQYIYLTLEEHTNEFVIYDYTTPTITLVGQADIGDINAKALFISEDKTKAFIGTENSSTLNEFYILDISNKNGDYPILTSHDLGGMSVNALVSIDNRVMIGGEGGQEYQVLNIDNILAPETCGGLSQGVVINDMSLVQTPASNFTYILTNDGSLNFIRGGQGGGSNGNYTGQGYAENGEFLSQIFDTQSSNSEFYIMSSKVDIPSETGLNIQLRASDSIDMSGSTWIGSDGTALTYFEGGQIFNLPPGLQGRYFQYKAILTSEGATNTPLLKEFTISYEK